MLVRVLLKELTQSDDEIGREQRLTAKPADIEAPDGVLAGDVPLDPLLHVCTHGPAQEGFVAVGAAKVALLGGEEDEVEVPIVVLAQVLLMDKRTLIRSLGDQESPLQQVDEDALERTHVDSRSFEGIPHSTCFLAWD